MTGPNFIFIHFNYCEEIIVIILNLISCLFQNFTSEGTKFSELYGEVDSVKNTTVNIWLNDGVY